MDTISVVSVIVPVYKVEPYLKICLRSIIDQTYRNLEIILVDDGSPDLCGVICDEFAGRDNRIKVIHKENQGLGLARNTGLEHATGEYVCFVDSDDWLTPNAIETWLHYQKEFNCDLVMCNYEKYDDNGNCLYKYEKVSRLTLFENPEAIEKNVFWPMIAQKSYVKEDFTINMCVWTNLYRNSIIKAHDIRFVSEREVLSEDIGFNLQYLLNCNIVAMIPESLYYYRFNPNSLTNHYKGNEFFKSKQLYSLVFTIANQAKNPIEREYRVHRFFFTKTRELLFRLCKSEKTFNEKSEIVKDIYNDVLLRQLIKEYPIFRYKIKYFVPAIMMKLKMYKISVLMYKYL